jgi:hypothetical protein
MLTFVLAACGGDQECEIDAVSRDLGGAGLLDCGIAPEDDTRTVDACAVMAHRSRQTFRALYERGEGRIEGIVHAVGDTYHLLRVTGDGAIARADCSGARVAQDGTRSHVVCDGDPAFEAVCE